MALTQGNWSKTSANGCNVWQCDVVQTTSENDNYTKVIDFINPNKPWLLIVNSAAASLDDAALPVDIWGGWSSAGLTGNDSTVAWTGGAGALLANGVMDDAKSTALSVKCDGAITVAPVVSTLAGVRGYVAPAPMPYYVINLDGAGALLAATCHFVIVQQY